MVTTTIRDLRNRFPKVKRLVETEGEVIVTDKGEPKYRLTAYTPSHRGKSGRPKDYIARLSRYQSRPISAAAAKSLLEENRGAR
jgi:prevent-host-death family protein